MDIIQKILQFISGGEWGGKSTGFIDRAGAEDFEDILSSILEDMLGKGISETEFKKLLEKFKNVFGNGEIGDDIVQFLLSDILRKMNSSPDGENELLKQKGDLSYETKDGELKRDIDIKLIEVVQKNHDKVNISTAGATPPSESEDENLRGGISIKNNEEKGSKDLELYFPTIKEKHFQKISTPEEFASKDGDSSSRTNFVRYSGNQKGATDELLVAWKSNVEQSMEPKKNTDVQVSDKTHEENSSELSKVSGEKHSDERGKMHNSRDQHEDNVHVNILKYKGGYRVWKKGNVKNSVEHVQLAGEREAEVKGIDDIEGNKKSEIRDKLDTENKKGKDINTEVDLDVVASKKVRKDKSTPNGGTEHNTGKNVVRNGKDTGERNLEQKSNKRGSDTLQNTPQDVDGNIAEFNTDRTTKEELSEKIEREIRAKASGSARNSNRSGKSPEDVSVSGGKSSERIVKGNDGFSTEMLKGEQNGKDKVDYMVYGDKTGKELNLGKEAAGRTLENHTSSLSERIQKMKEVILDSVRISMNSHNKRAVVEANVLGTKVTVDVVVEARNVSVVINTADSSLRSEISKNFDNFRRFLEENNFQLMRFDVGGGDTTGRGGGGYNMEFANEFAGMYGRFRGNHVGSISVEHTEKISAGTIFVNTRGRFNIIA